jgi:hypothetical protein
VRSLARRHGYLVRKSKRKQLCVENHGEYMLVDTNNWVMLGARYDATLDEIEAFCRGEGRDA